MAGLRFPGQAVYRPPEPGADNAASFELIPWVLGRCATAAEARDLLEHDVRLVYLYNQLLQASMEEHWHLKTVLHKRSAMERYQWFLETYPGLIDQVTHRYVASFLEMSPVTLSRLRSALR